MNFASRIEKLPPYLFAEISRKIAEKRSQGVDVISFGIGDPDLPTPERIIESLREASLDAANHRYPETQGLPELREAIARWYERRFGVSLDPQREVLPLIGSKEGIGHIALCFIEAGEVALVPDPGYPVYAMGTLLAGGEAYYLPLQEENAFLPDLEGCRDRCCAGPGCCGSTIRIIPPAPWPTSRSSSGRRPSPGSRGWRCCTTARTRR